MGFIVGAESAQGGKNAVDDDEQYLATLEWNVRRQNTTCLFRLLGIDKGLSLLREALVISTHTHTHTHTHIIIYKQPLRSARKNLYCRDAVKGRRRMPVTLTRRTYRPRILWPGDTLNMIRSNTSDRTKIDVKASRPRK